MKIPFFHINKTNYPCRENGFILKIIYISFILFFMLLLASKFHKEGLGGLLVILLLGVVPILIFNIVTIIYDIKLIKRILQEVGGKKGNFADIWEYLEQRKGARIHFLIRRRTEVLLLLGKLLEYHSKMRREEEKLSIAHALIETAITYDPRLKRLSRSDDLSFVAQEVSVIFNKNKNMDSALMSSFSICVLALTFFLIIATIINILVIILKIIID